MMDEVFRGIEFGCKTPCSIIDLSEKTVVIDSLSKKMGVPGLRIGWIASKDKKIIEECRKMKAYTSICNSIISDILGIVVLKEKKRFLERGRKLVKENCRIVFNWIKKQDKIRCVIPKAGAVCFPSYDLKLNSFELCEEIVRKTGVLLIPGLCFSMDKHIRLGYGYDKEKLIEGLRRIQKYFN
jgi:aspartate/methionine/tyrosine aminotransferase